ncbi:MAG: leucine-rich repeat protein, partial [Clostridia bacterium]|nr:leucine-rich repeat protein [Clostridia bacterium]
IGEITFANCYALENIHIPNTVKSIGPNAFSGCNSLFSLVLPEGLETISAYAFAYSDGLRHIVLPESLSHISADAFNGCGNITEIVNNSNISLTFGSTENGCIAEHAKIITDKNGNRVYREGYEDYDFIITQDEFVFIKENGTYYLLAYIGDKDTVTLPTDINGNEYVIYWFTGAKNVIIPEGRTKIDDGAFAHISWYTSSTLETVVLPSTITEIGSSAFADCTALKQINIPQSIQSILDYAFTGCTSLTEITVPSSVKNLGYYVFSGCTALEKITLPNTLTYIGADLLKDTKLYNNPANWEDGCLYIGTNLIKVSESVTHIEVRDTTTCIAKGAFNGCHQLKGITASTTVNEAFAGASNIEVLVLKGSGSEWLDNIYNALGRIQPITLKYIVLESEFELSIDSYLNVFDMISGVTIFVEKEDQNLRWDANFPGWSNENRVIYGDDWTWLEFKNSDGDIIYRQPRLVNQVIIRPYISAPEPNGDIAYKFVGWDIDGDGVADKIPATSAVDISAQAIFVEVERKHTVSFVDTDGKVIFSAVLDYGTIITAPATPQKKGHTFTGWSNFEQGMVAEKDVVFTAQWHHDGSGHVWSAPSIIAPTCTEKGYTVTTCGICDMQIISNTTSPIGHSWGSVDENVKPSCETEGSGYHVCTSCGEKENVVIEANGHAFKAVQETASTCETHGKVVHKCSECGKTVETQKVLASHYYVKQEIDKNTADALRKNVSDIFILQENGKYFCYKCSVCDKFMLAGENTFSSSASVQSGCRHSNLSEWEVLIPANCASFGIDVRYCLDCDKPIEVRIGAAAGSGHAWGDWFITFKPTCSEKGEKKRECTACDCFET